MFSVLMKVLWALLRWRVSSNTVEKVMRIVTWKDDKHTLSRSLMHSMEINGKSEVCVDHRFTELTDNVFEMC